MRTAQLIKETRTQNPLSGKPIKVRRTHFGAIGKLRNAHLESIEGEEMEELGGRGKARRDARASKKVRKAKAPTRKENKASKVKSKNKLRADKGIAKKTKADAKTIKAEKGGGGKIGDTLNKAMDLGTELLGKKGGGEDANESAEQTPTEKTFMQKNGLLIGGIALVVIAIIIYFVTKKK